MPYPSGEGSYSAYGGGECGIGIEGAQSASSPTQHQIGGRFLLVFIGLQPCGQFEEGAEEGSAIVIYQLDQARLLHQAAKLDQLACPGAPVLHPLAGVVTRPGGIEAVTPHGQALELRCCGPEILEQSRLPRLSFPVCPLTERTPARVWSTPR
jgi:hypothetical protein